MDTMYYLIYKEAACEAEESVTDRLVCLRGSDRWMFDSNKLLCKIEIQRIRIRNPEILILSVDFFFHVSYFVSKKQFAVLYMNLLYNMGHYFLDTQ